MTTIEILPPVPKDTHPCRPLYEFDPKANEFPWVDGALRQCAECGQYWEGTGRWWFRVTNREAKAAMKRRAKAAP